MDVSARVLFFGTSQTQARKTRKPRILQQLRPILSVLFGIESRALHRDEIAVSGCQRRRLRDLACLQQCCIRIEQLSQQRGSAPTIEDLVVEAHYKLAGIVRPKLNFETQERRLLPIKLPLLLRFERRSHDELLLVFGEMAQVFFFERYRYGCVDQL